MSLSICSCVNHSAPSLPSVYRPRVLHRCICHRFKATQPKLVRKVNSLNCAVNSIHQPKGNFILSSFFFVIFFLYIFYSPFVLPLFWCWATKAYISLSFFFLFFSVSPPPPLIEVYNVARIEKKRGNLIPLVPNVVYIYIYISRTNKRKRESAMGKYESYRYRPTVSFWSRLLSVISDGQADESRAPAHQPALLLAIIFPGLSYPYIQHSEPNEVVRIYSGMFLNLFGNPIISARPESHSPL